ncbi:MAG: thrombospondin type 3 repeat-containing protein, partial [Candidatus Omnitrophica bacterium]|nr:thrombospondin type 3 repeat-containing protein [Candidatus Omnitrophota bacterium]
GNLNALPDLPATLFASGANNPAWFRQATLGAGSVEKAQPASMVDIPVYVNARPGCSLAGLQFRATLSPQGYAPPLTAPLQYVPASSLPGPFQSMSPSPNVLLCSWALVPAPAFEPPLQGSNQLGSIRFTVPDTAQPGQLYSLHFSYVDGARDLNTQYDLESIPASVWIESAALEPPELVSDEWKAYFFGSLTNSIAMAKDDPDGDGFPNSVEYQAGTNPLQRDWSCRFDNGNFTVRWFGETGRRYVVEFSPDMFNWTQVGDAFTGLGQWLEFADTRSSATNRFYRVRTQP